MFKFEFLFKKIKNIIYKNEKLSKICMYDLFVLRLRFYTYDKIYNYICKKQFFYKKCVIFFKK